MRQARTGPVATVAAAISLAIAPGGAALAACPTAGESVQVAGVEPNLDLLLADGRVVALAGLAVDRETSAFPALAARLTGARVRLALVDARPDRWGRVSALVYFNDGRIGESDVAQEAIMAGVGLYSPDPLVRDCREAFLRAEGEARAQARGLWSDPRRAVIPASDLAAFEKAGKGLVVVEGIVSSIGERRGRIYLNFGPRRTVDFALVISRRNLDLFDAATFPLRDLVGRRVRARGLLDRAFGPYIEIDGPDALEMIGTTQGAPARGGREG